jgi:hypothetical protein
VDHGKEIFIYGRIRIQRGREFTANMRHYHGIIYVKHSDVVISLQTVSIKGNAGENNRFFP